MVQLYLSYKVNKVVSLAHVLWLLLLTCHINQTNTAPLSPSTSPHWCPVGHDLPSGPYNQADLKKLLELLITNVRELHQHIGGTKINLRGQVNGDYSNDYPTYVKYLSIPVGSNVNSHKIEDVLQYHGEDLTNMMTFLDHFITIDTGIHESLPPLFKDSQRLTRALLCDMEKLYWAQTTQTYVGPAKPLTNSVQNVFNSQINLIAFEALYHTYDTNTLYLQSDLTNVLLNL